MKKGEGLRNKLPWYTISLLITVLGAISIVLFFGLYYFGASGFIFWAIVCSWIIILIITTLEISRLEALQKFIIKEYESRIEELQKEIEASKKG